MGNGEVKCYVILFILVRSVGEASKNLCANESFQHTQPNPILYSNISAYLFGYLLFTFGGMLNNSRDEGEHQHSIRYKCIACGI